MLKNQKIYSTVKGLVYTLKNYSDGLGHLIFTNTCLHCQNELTFSERFLCWFCWESLERTFFEHQTVPTRLDQLFWGRVQIKHTCALYYYSKDNICQSLIRSLKYDFNAPLGVFLGEHLANEIKEHPIRFVDAIIPVPLHPKKKFARGYNQSELLAKGLAKNWNVPILNKATFKKRNTKSQTKKDRFGRWENVQNMFELHLDLFQFKHILIVDDVVTTGATLESLIVSIQQKAPEVQISLLSFAFTK
jgi:competence protein ComFC